MLEEISPIAKDEEYAGELFSELCLDEGIKSTGESTLSPESSRSSPDNSRLIELEDEQERLNTSLLALTSHFAQVQFRLKQICQASGDEKEILLKELEEFTFKGCPDLSEIKSARLRGHSVSDSTLSSQGHEAVVEKQRLRQLQLIKQLKDQLEDLERFAYETGEAGLPTCEVMQKQTAFIDQLRSKMELDVDFASLSPEELQLKVDHAVKRLVNPIKVKEQLVQQLQTQITDLERFIDFLQDEGAVAGNFLKCICSTNLESQQEKKACPVHNAKSFIPAKRVGYEKPIRHEKAWTLLNQTLSLIQIYILAQMGCQSEKFRRNHLKKSAQGCHYGDIRAHLELAIQSVAATVTKLKNQEKPDVLKAYCIDEDETDDDVFDQCPEELVGVVRKSLCPALRDLLQHGMIRIHKNDAYLTLRLGCFSSRTKQIEHNSMDVHAWEIVRKYFEMKHGKEFSEDPARRLSQSFNLDIVGGRAVTSKQLLLFTVDSILTSHSRLKRSQDAMFKAFVSAALNHKKLVGWLRMILRTKEISDEFYLPWSYVVKTGFDDACGSLEKLNVFSFKLPVDLAVRPFQNIKDIF